MIPIMSLCCVAVRWAICCEAIVLVREPGGVSASKEERGKLTYDLENWYGFVGFLRGCQCLSFFMEGERFEDEEAVGE